MDRETEQHRIDLIAVDGGASRCRLAAFDDRGARVAEIGIDAPASLTLGEVDAWRTIREGIGRLLGTSGASGASPRPAWPAALAFGLAGALRDDRRARFLDRVACDTGGVRCHLVTDGHAQLVGAGLGRPAVCLAVGTGSVVHWLAEDGTRGIAGGWGFPVGDEGSGAWLGARLLQRYLWHRDGQTSDSPLMAVLESRLGGSVSTVQAVTTDARSTTHARLAPLVVEAAAEGDALACSLLDEGGEWCARLVGRAPPGLPVHVVGGLAEAYASRLAARLGSRLSPARGDALDGLALIAREAVT